MASAAVFRSPRSSDQQRSGRLLVRPTPHMRALHALSLRQAKTDTTDRQRFSLSLLFFPHGENTRLDTHTQTHSATAVSLNTTPTSGIRHLYAPACQRLTLTFCGRFLVFRQCHLTTQALAELRTLLPIQLSAAFTSRRRLEGKPKFHCLSLGLYNI